MSGPSLPTPPSSSSSPCSSPPSSYSSAASSLLDPSVAASKIQALTKGFLHRKALNQSIGAAKASDGEGSKRSPFVPTSDKIIQLLFSSLLGDLLPSSPSSPSSSSSSSSSPPVPPLFVDIGSGDGRVVLFAAQRGWRARGIEVERGLYEKAEKKRSEMGERERERAQFLLGSAFEGGEVGQALRRWLAEAAVVFLFLLPIDNKEIEEMIGRECRRGTTVVSSMFTLKSLELVAKKEVEKEGGICLYKYKVP